MPTVKPVFELQTVVLPLSRLLPIRQVKPTDHCFGKYNAILASIRNVGLIEPLMVHPHKGNRDQYIILDGHMRFKALTELNRVEAECLIATEDDAFTYNDQVSRLAPIQEHRMIMKAIEQGVTPEAIAQSLDVEVAKIKRGMNLLDGIHPDAVDLLKDKPINESALSVFKKVKAMRQLDFAHLMVSMNNYSPSYARALLIGTHQDMLVKPRTPKAVKGVTPTDLSQMEKEMETLERDFRLYQDNYGENTLSLNVVQRYVKRLTDNTQVKRFLTKRYSEIMDELNDLAAMESL